MENDELIQDFLEESYDTLEMLHSTLEEMAQDLESTTDDQFDALFRGVHTIKGGSGMFSFENTAHVAHDLETYLGELKKTPENFTSEVLNYVRRRVDLIESLLKNGDVSEGKESLDGKPPEEDDSESAPKQLPETHYFSEFYENFDEMIWDFLNRGVAQFEILLEPAKKDKVNAILEKLGAMSLHEEEVAGRVACLYVYEGDDFDTLLQVVEKIKNLGDFHWIYNPYEQKSDVSNEEVVEASADEGSPKEKTEENEQKKKSSSPQTSDVLRIPLERVSGVLDNVWEMFLVRNQLAYLIDQYRETFKEFSGFLQEFDALDTQLRRNIAEVESKTMSMRMSSVKNIFKRMEKVVSSYSDETGKAIHFKTEGEHVELDKKVIDMLNEPLIHLIRNAMDHGIEKDEGERIEAGKSRPGNITLHAKMNGNKAVIEIKDDGKGIDPQKILQIAKDKGLDTSHVRTDEDAVNLIFMPGFSTAESVSDVSGRGVGMDAVKYSVESLGGEIDLQTELGKGSVFSVELPLGMSVISALIVKVNGFTYALNSQTVEKTQRISVFDLKKNGEEEYYYCDGEYIRCFPLEKSFEGKKKAQHGGVQTETSICVVRGENELMAIRIDDILQSTGLVAKPSPKNAAPHPFVSGVSLLQSGQPVIILDIHKILKELQKADKPFECEIGRGKNELSA